MSKTIMFVGHGRAGKDEALLHLAKITTLRNAGTTSKYLCNYVAQKLGLSPEEAYARRHESDEMRMTWYNAGNELREKGPTTLIQMALEHGEMTGGVRALDEIVAAREEGLIDLIVWVDNERVKPDPTVMFTQRECDLVIPNHWSLAEYHSRLERFARFAGLPMRGETPKSVFAVLHYDYGDQGGDYHGVFATQKLAQEFIDRREPNRGERKHWDICESPVLSA